MAPESGGFPVHAGAGQYKIVQISTSGVWKFPTQAPPDTARREPSTVKAATAQVGCMYPLATAFPDALSGTVALLLALVVTAAWLYYFYR